MFQFKFSSKPSQTLIAVAFVLSSLLTISAQTSNPQSPKNNNAAVKTSAAQTPSQTVKNFYQALSEQRFREALLLTNWRQAIEQFTPEETEDLRRNFAHLARQAKVEVTGEQLSGAAASVFVKGVNPESGEMKVEEVRLRRENNGWTIVFGDAATEEALKREGKNYIFKLWMESRHQDAQFMLEDIYKAEFVYSMLAGDNSFADMNTLVNKKLLSPDVLSADSGYRFRLLLAPDRKKFSVNAEPVAYGKTGKLSFLLQIGKDGKPVLNSSDNKGAPYAIKN